MTKMPRTHYDNLKVSSAASTQEIRQSYRRLVSKHHPDRNGNSPESIRIMQIINQSYEVLLDPIERARHDRWILQKKAELASLHSFKDAMQRKAGNDPFSKAYSKNKKTYHFSDSDSSDEWFDSASSHDDAERSKRAYEDALKKAKADERAKRTKSEDLEMIFKESIGKFFKIEKEIITAREKYFTEHNKLSFYRRWARQMTWVLVPSRKPLSVQEMSRHHTLYGVIPEVGSKPVAFLENLLIFCGSLCLICVMAW